jgi:WD40 repeat protein
MLSRQPPALRPLRSMAASALAAALLAAAAPAQSTERVSVDSTGGEGNDSSIGRASLSSDGRRVAFTSYATNLVAGDANGSLDVFLHDRNGGATELVSVSTAGTSGDSACYYVSLSGDGMLVAFDSAASNLVVGDTNGQWDIFLRDRTAGTTTLVSVDASGTQGNGNSYFPAISADGLFVAFYSTATNLVAGDTNACSDVFVRDLSAGTTELVSVDSSGTQGNDQSYSGAISSDGRFVAFTSLSTNFVPGDTNGLLDVFVRDRLHGTTERVSIDSSGAQADAYSWFPALSADGSLVAFESFADNLVPGDSNGRGDSFVHDRASGTTERVSLGPNGVEANWDCELPSISADGRFVSFSSRASNLVAGDSNFSSDVFVRDRTVGVTRRESVDSAGAEGDGDSFDANLSTDGSTVVFGSRADNLVANDTNRVEDTFVHGLCTIDASWSNYGSGYPGTLGVPTFTARANPVLGTTVALDLADSSGLWSYGVLFVGLQRANLHTSFGGDLLVLPLFTEPVALPPVGAMLFLDLPGDDSLCSVAADLQVLEADPGATKGVSFTPGLELVLGR